MEGERRAGCPPSPSHCQQSLLSGRKATPTLPPLQNAEEARARWNDALKVMHSRYDWLTSMDTSPRFATRTTPGNWHRERRSGTLLGEEKQVEKIQPTWEVLCGRCDHPACNGGSAGRGEWRWGEEERERERASRSGGEEAVCTTSRMPCCLSAHRPALTWLRFRPATAPAV